jgi:hypothetical protein
LPSVHHTDKNHAKFCNSSRSAAVPLAFHAEFSSINLLVAPNKLSTDTNQTSKLDHAEWELDITSHLVGFAFR